jgi:hypothetical protein
MFVVVLVVVVVVVVVVSGETVKFTALKVTGQCPLFLLVKVGGKQGKVFGSEEGSVLDWTFGSI